MATRVLFTLLCGTAQAVSVWPAPKSTAVTTDQANQVQLELAHGFSFHSKTSLAILGDAFSRYTKLLAASGSFADAGLQTVEVVVASADEALFFGVNESYQIDIANGAATIHAATVFGALHALETFVQLADNYGRTASAHLSVPAQLHISDAPRFAWRGLMIDVARHYYPMPFLEHIVDTMAASKLNVLHVHFTDDQSFPVESTQWPKLTDAGAFRDAHGTRLVYTHDDLRALVTFATSRGVVVVPEFDMPAHTSAWGAGYPEYLTQLPGHLFDHGDALRPDLNATYSFVDALLGELASFFPTSEFLHLGGDELPATTWRGNATVAAWMKARGFDNDQAMSYLVNRVKGGPKLAAANKTLVYWEEVFASAGVHLPVGTVVQAWKSNAMPAVLAAGHRVTNSYKWYLNHGCDNFGDGNWPAFYENDPLHFVKKDTPPEQLELIVGGETTMWAECVDAVIFDSIVWPRAAAAAEKLWSPRAATGHASASVAARLQEHRCRLVARGVPAAPLNDASARVELGEAADERIFVAGCM